MKSILISEKPKQVALEMNGIKKIEVRKTAPKDWKDYLSGKTKEIPKPIDVYIYCTKTKILGNIIKVGSQENSDLFGKNTITGINKGFMRKGDIDLQGKVVAKFTLNKVEEINVEYFDTFNGLFLNNLLQKSCLTIKQIDDYLGNKSGYAWYIDNLVIFDKPKELNEFYKGFRRKYYKNHFAQDIHKEKNALVQPIKCGYEYTYPLTKAPESFCYVEVE